MYFTSAVGKISQFNNWSYYLLNYVSYLVNVCDYAVLIENTNI